MIKGRFFFILKRPREKETVSKTLSNRPRVSSWGTKPIKERVDLKSVIISMPSTLTVPDVGFIMPQMQDIRVVLPAPLEPSRARISPRLISRLTSKRALWPDLNVFDRFLIEMILSVIWQLYLYKNGL